MTKSELKTGMLVELRNGELCMVFVNSTSIYTEKTYSATDVMVAINRKYEWHKMESFNEDLTHCDPYYKNDIVKVMRVQHPYCFPNPKMEGYDKTEIIWERKEKKRYTYAELREILGEEFEVVG